MTKTVLGVMLQAPREMMIDYIVRVALLYYYINVPADTGLSCLFAV